MLVRERMNRHPITVRPQVSLHDALKLMRREHIHHLPVVNGEGQLVGIVSERDLLYASPSPATDLSVHELNDLIAKVTVDELMSTSVVTICEDCPLEEAARIMVDQDISALPVMRGERLVGLVTQKDLFQMLLELLGARSQGLRVTLTIPESDGVVHRLTHDLSERGAEIVALGTFWGNDAASREITFKTRGIGRETLEAVARDLGAHIVDARET